jgi:hypothetical protein
MTAGSNINLILICELTLEVAATKQGRFSLPLGILQGEHLHTALNLPYAYDYATILCGQRAEVYRIKGTTMFTK